MPRLLLLALLLFITSCSPYAFPAADAVSYSASVNNFISKADKVTDKIAGKKGGKKYKKYLLNKLIVDYNKLPKRIKKNNHISFAMGKAYKAAGLYDRAEKMFNRIIQKEGFLGPSEDFIQKTKKELMDIRKMRETKS